MLRAPTRTVQLDSRNGLTGAAILSATMHAAIVVVFIFDFSSSFPAEDVTTFEVDLVVLEPEVKNVPPEKKIQNKTPQEQKDVLSQDSDRPIQTTSSSLKRNETPSQSSNPRSSDSEKKKHTTLEKDFRAEDENVGKEPLQSNSQPTGLAKLARLVDKEKSSVQKFLPFNEVPGCSAATGGTAPTSYVDQLAKSGQTGRSYAQAAVIAQMSGDYRKAIDLYDAAIRAGDLSRNNLAEVYNNRGAAYRSLGFSSLAIDDYNEAMRLKPGYAVAYFNRGVAYSLSRNKELAIRDFTRSIQLDSGFADPYYQRGIIYAQQAAHRQAISDFSHAIKLAPCLASAYFERGRELESVGDLDRAIADFKKSYDLDPNSKKYKTKLLSLTSP